MGDVGEPETSSTGEGFVIDENASYMAMSVDTTQETQSQGCAGGRDTHSGKQDDDSE